MSIDRTATLGAYEDVILGQTVAALKALKDGNPKKFVALVVAMDVEAFWAVWKALTGGYVALDKAPVGPYNAAIFLTLLSAGAWNHKISDAADGWKTTEQAMNDIRARIASIGCPLPVVVPHKDNAYFDSWIDTRGAYARDDEGIPAGMEATYRCLLQKFSELAVFEGTSVWQPDYHQPRPMPWIDHQPLLFEALSPAVSVAFLTLLGKPGSPTTISSIDAPSYMTAVAHLVPPAATPTFPVGSVARWNAPTSEWWIYFPGNPGGLTGALAGALRSFDPAPDARVSGSADAPPVGTVKGKPMLTPFYKKAIFWVITVTATAAVAGGAYYVIRRRRRLGAVQ